MRLLDVVNQLRFLLPKYTDYFSSTLSISSIVASGGTITVITSSDHGLVTGQAISINDVLTQTPIDDFSNDGFIFTFHTSSDHDLTYGWPEHDEVTFVGFTDSTWNGSFSLTDVLNRNIFKIQSTNSSPVLNGNEKLLEKRVDGPNGFYSVTVVDPTTFTVTSSSVADGTYIGGTMSPAARIAGTVNIDRAIDEYTEQAVTDFWGFVSMHDGEISKDRHTDSDATSTPGTGTALRLRLIDGFTLFVIVNTSNDIASQDAVDICRHELLLPILRCIYGARFSSGLSAGPDFKTIFTGHGFVSYDKAIYVHSYSFELSMDLTEDDAVLPEDTRAYRDIDFSQSVLDSDAMTVTIDLDEDPDAVA